MTNQKKLWWIVFILLMPQCVISLKKLIDIYINNSYISYPALPLISQEIMKIKPILGGALKPDVLKDICALAQDKITTQETTRKLLNENRDLESIRNSSSPEALLINDNKSSREMICAAYMANLPFQEIPFNNSYDLDGTNKNKMIINDKVLADALMTRIAIVRANADLYTLIASKISNYKASSLDEYRQKIIEIFSEESAVFLKAAERYYIENKSNNITIYKTSDSEFEFNLSNWRYSIIDDSNLVLKNNGVTWFGKNYLLGSQYYIKVRN